jgi:hypothetical protein
MSKYKPSVPLSVLNVENESACVSCFDLMLNTCIAELGYNDVGVVGGVSLGSGVLHPQQQSE